MDIFEADEMITKMVDGFEPAVTESISQNYAVATTIVREQIYSGLDGNDRQLSPTYDSDPYFDTPESGRWYHNAEGYKHWKMQITPPEAGELIGLPPRPENVPNLYINGKFHSEIFSVMNGDLLSVGVSDAGDGPDIVSKYGDNLLRLGPTAIGYFNNTYIIPHVWDYFARCGYEN